MLPFKVIYIDGLLLNKQARRVREASAERSRKFSRRSRVSYLRAACEGEDRRRRSAGGASQASGGGDAPGRPLRGFGHPTRGSASFGSLIRAFCES